MKKHRLKLLRALARDAAESVEEAIALASGYPGPEDMRSGILALLTRGPALRQAVQEVHAALRRESGPLRGKVRAEDRRKMAGRVQAARRDRPLGWRLAHAKKARRKP